MKTLFVTRHKGAQEWVRRKGVSIDRWETHLDLEIVERGDIVIGILPISMAAEVCARGAIFFELAVSLPAELRGKELTADQLGALGATLRRYHVIELAHSC